MTAALPAAADPGGSAGIKGYVYADAGNDGYFDVNDTPLAGVGITLESGGVKVTTTTTDESGLFAFEGLQPGTYRLLEHQPKAYRDGVEAAGNGAVLVDNDTIEVVVAKDEVSSGNLFAEVPAEPGVTNPDFPVTVSGQTLVFDPLANDGVLDGDSGFDPASVRLLNPLTGLPVSEFEVPGQASYRVLEDGRIEVVPVLGFVGWVTEVGYEAKTFDGRHSTSVIGLEVRQRLTSGPTGRQLGPS
ncbi:SdrD B-like domain-containing protein [Microlunatus sp. GCM10028923]|uniref:SdrD B-like domain-containing protein n=1 Tax=Microlunatus sp. GCM10028923 TaxID=3273400 RepID=UPI003619B16C